jgi:hypothetical protein
VPGSMVEQVAHRVAELVAAQRHEPFRLVDTETVARMLAVSEGWVRNHAVELGGMRVGDGPRSPLRFDAARVRAALDRRRLERPPTRPPRRPGRPRRSGGVSPSVIPSEVAEW